MSKIEVNELSVRSGTDITFNDTVKIDTIKGKTAAGSITVQGENTATTNLQQGLAKAWGNAPGSAASINDSFNVTSLTDSSAGDMRYNLTNNMSATEYSFTVAHQYTTVIGTGAFFDNPITGETSSFRMQHYENGSKADAHKYSGGTLHGDLA